MTAWRKAIPQSRDRMQSTVLLWSVGLALSLMCARISALAIGQRWFLVALALSAVFGVIVWSIRAGTATAAVMGSMICLLITIGTERTDRTPFQSALAPLMALFLLTFLATRSGRQKKQARRLEESREGRSGSQVIANLGFAGLLSGLLAGDRIGGIAPQLWSHDGFDAYFLPLFTLAALAEATADTVSSEIGQAYGREAYLITTLRSVPAGTDGGVSLIGSAAGVAAGALVVGIGAWAMQFRAEQVEASLAGALGGFVFDSLLGATIERKGWLGNDLVNFTSTVFAGVAALAFLLWKG